MRERKKGRARDNSHFFKLAVILYSDDILAFGLVRLLCPDCRHNPQRLPPLPLWTSSKPGGSLLVDAVSFVRRLVAPAGLPRVLSCRRGPCSRFEGQYNKSCKFLRTAICWCGGNSTYLWLICSRLCSSALKWKKNEQTRQDALLKKNIEANEITQILTRGVEIVKVGCRYNISLYIIDEWKRGSGNLYHIGIPIGVNRNWIRHDMQYCIGSQLK